MAVMIDESVQALIQSLIDFNSSTLNRGFQLMEKIEADLSDAAGGQLQGETEELLRMILETAGKSIETLLAMQEELQKEVIESYFPAQD